jgi:mono/diheme cytochrome c family protein
LLIALYAVGGLLLGRLYINGATALTLVALAFGATAGGEFVREGARKPFTIRQVLYSNSLTPADVERMRREGSAARDPWPLSRSYPNVQLEMGERVFRTQCLVCHTLEGVNGLVHLTGTWSLDQKRMNIAKLQQTKAFMPPFAGTSAELEALVQMLSWVAADEPASWSVHEEREDLEQIQRWLDEAGTDAGHASQRASLRGAAP